MRSALLLSTLPTVVAVRSFVKNAPIDLEQNRWVSLDKGTEFLQGDSDVMRRVLASSSTGSINPYSTQAFVDGDQDYDEYQQAWRYLGFIIDCDASNDDDDGSYDGGTGEGCQRYVMWAAYVDLEYEGGGIGEYQYYDPLKQRWDDTSCNYSGGGGSGDGSGDGDGSNRCAKMDCHLADTHFSLLGIFKHKSYDDWFEQLFKHEGYCVWNSEQYGFMKNARKAWPQGCEESSSTQRDGSPIYYDLQPTYGGGIKIGLYTDTRCVENYKGRKSVEDVVGNLLMEAGSGSGDEEYEEVTYDSLSESLKAWDSAFQYWHVCQPCVAYDLNNVGYDTDDDASKGSSYWNYANMGGDDDYNQNDDDYANYNWGNFDCYDDADYVNVNQCMKFMAKTQMNAATYRDLSLAIQQGSTEEFSLTSHASDVGGRSFAKSAQASRRAAKSFGVVVFFLVSICICFSSFRFFSKVRKETKFELDASFREPLAVFA